MAVVFVVKGLVIRTCEPRDAPAILSVYRQCEDFLSLGPVRMASMEMVIADIDRSAALNGQYCVIEDVHGEMIGVLDFIPRAANNTGVLSLLMISEPHRNRGYGKAIVGALESYLQAACKIGILESGVHVNNPDGIRFWRNRGFQIGTTARHHADGTTAYDMNKVLKPSP